MALRFFKGLQMPELFVALSPIVGRGILYIIHPLSCRWLLLFSKDSFCRPFNEKTVDANNGVFPEISIDTCRMHEHFITASIV